MTTRKQIKEIIEGLESLGISAGEVCGFLSYNDIECDGCDGYYNMNCGGVGYIPQSELAEIERRNTQTRRHPWTWMGKNSRLG